MTAAARLAVVDASVALRWVLPGQGQKGSWQVLSLYQADELTLIAPRSFMEEVASVLARQYRRKLISAGQAEEAFRWVEHNQPRLSQEAHNLTDAFALSLRHQLSLWDCLYLALAIQHRCSLLTTDRRFYNNASKHYPYVEWVG